MQAMRLCIKCIENNSLGTNSKYSKPITYIFRKFCSFKLEGKYEEEVSQLESLSKPTITYDTKTAEDNSLSVTHDNSSVLNPCNEDISTVAPRLPPSFNFAVYVNQSPTLQQLVKNNSLGTNSKYSKPIVNIFRKFCSFKLEGKYEEEARQLESLSNPTITYDTKTAEDNSLSVTNDNGSVLNPCNEDISTVAPHLPPSFNFAAYVNQSPTLQQLVKLGVDLHALEKKRDVPEYILRLDFERDMKDHLRFLHNAGVSADQLGKFLTKNPIIFRENLDDLAVRINYLESKRFTSQMIASIVQRNPKWLNFSTREIDNRFGFFQSTFKLSGSEVRTITLKSPRLITYSLHNVKINNFSIKEEMGFSDSEIHALIVKEPTLWTKGIHNLLHAFKYAHNEMKLTHDQLVAFPQILKSRPFRIKQRHLFLESLDRAQYNPKLEGYISPDRLVCGTDTEFCHNVARSSIETFNIFLKSL